MLQEYLLNFVRITSNLLPEKFLWRLRPYYRAFLPEISNILFLPTFSCNYRCPYCLIHRTEYAKQYPVKNEIVVSKWLKAFEKFEPSIINISGGEPFIYPEFIKLLLNFPRKHFIVGIHTNLSLVNINKLIEIPNKDFYINASFHPHMVNKESFSKKILELKNIGIKVRVSLVAYPQIIEEIETYKFYFEHLIGVRFNVDPYIDPSYKYSDEELKILKKFSDRGIISKNRTLCPDFKENKLKQCLGGSKYFTVVPNGDVYSCVAGFYYSTELYEIYNRNKENFYLGNLFQDNFKPLNGPRTCSLPCSEACDIQCAKVTLL